MNIVLVKQGMVELRDSNGNLIRTISCSGTNAVSADLSADGSKILITTGRGEVELRRSDGNLVRWICSSNAVDADWSGQDILVKTSSGNVELRREDGNLIRTLWYQSANRETEKFPFPCLFFSGTNWYAFCPDATQNVVCVQIISIYVARKQDSLSAVERNCRERTEWFMVRVWNTRKENKRRLECFVFTSGVIENARAMSAGGGFVEIQNLIIQERNRNGNSSHEAR